MANMLAEILIPKHKQKKRRLEKRSLMICSRLPSISLKFQCVCFWLLSLEAIQKLYTLWVCESVLSRFECPKEKQKYQPLQLQTRSKWGTLPAHYGNLLLHYYFFISWRISLLLLLPILFLFGSETENQETLEKSSLCSSSGPHYQVRSKSHKEKAL